MEAGWVDGGLLPFSGSESSSQASGVLRLFLKCGFIPEADLPAVEDPFPCRSPSSLKERVRSGPGTPWGVCFCLKTAS